MINLNYI